MGGYDGYRGWIYHLAVHSASRRRGVGSALVRAIEGQLARLGATKINLQIRTSNAGVAAFYGSLGYDVEERISMGRVVPPEGEEVG